MSAPRPGRASWRDAALKAENSPTWRRRRTIERSLSTEVIGTEPSNRSAAILPMVQKPIPFGCAASSQYCSSRNSVSKNCRFGDSAGRLAQEPIVEVVVRVLTDPRWRRRRRSLPGWCEESRGSACSPQHHGIEVIGILRGLTGWVSPCHHTQKVDPCSRLSMRAPSAHSPGYWRTHPVLVRGATNGRSDGPENEISMT